MLGLLVIYCGEFRAATRGRVTLLASHENAAAENSLGTATRVLLSDGRVLIAACGDEAMSMWKQAADAGGEASDQRDQESAELDEPRLPQQKTCVERSSKRASNGGVT